jgi:hypothetical protein
MRKAIFILFFIASIVLGSSLVLWSVGWMLALFGFVLIPLIILHIVSGIIAINRYPQFNRWAMGSWLAFLVFALARPDLDDKSNYSGLSMLLHHYGMREDQYVESDTLYFLISISAITVLLILDLMICVKSRRKRKTPTPPNEHV